MYVRRFREGAADDINRYRGRIGIAHPVAVGRPHRGNRSRSYESFYERKGGWNRDRIWSGVTLPVTKQRDVSAVLHVGNAVREIETSTICCSV